MNILFTNSAKQYGGNERWMCTAANALSERGHNVFFAGRNDLLYDKLNNKIEKFNFPFKHEFDRKTSTKIIQIIKEKHVEILFPTKRKENYLLAKIGKNLNIPVVFRLGIYRKIRKFDFPQRYVYKSMPNKIIVNAKIIKDYLIDDNIVSHDKVEVVYNGYEFKNDFDTWQFPFNVDGKFIFSTAGRLTHQKGYDILLKGVKLLKEKRDDFHLFIAGDGTDKENFLNYIEENQLSNNITLLGNISNVRGFFKATDCVVIPSRAEGIPNTMMEAWSVKTPVIAANAAGIPEAIENGANGLLFELEVKEIANSMLKMITDSSLIDKFGVAGYKTLNEKFTLEKMIDNLENIFHEVITKKGLLP